MAKVTLFNDDGSQVDFLDPAGVQAAVDAAVSALPTAEVPVTVEEVKVEESDGSEVVLEAAPEA